MKRKCPSQPKALLLRMYQLHLHLHHTIIPSYHHTIIPSSFLLLDATVTHSGMHSGPTRKGRMSTAELLRRKQRSFFEELRDIEHILFSESKELFVSKCRAYQIPPDQQD
jgi:hypothetical protein